MTFDILITIFNKTKVLCNMKVLIFLCLIHLSIGLKASQGCNGPQPPEPVPGEHGAFFFTYYDKDLGAVERNYFIQIPKGTSSLNNKAFCSELIVVFKIIAMTIHLLLFLIYMDTKAMLKIK